jgi:hypothetical protein
MPSEGFFVRDPREVPFLNDEVKKLLILAQECARHIQVKEDDDFGFMSMHFLYKQMHHVESVLSLVPSRDAGLIARTMIDGFYQLLWAAHAPEERSRLWRSFSIIHDWRLIQDRIREGIPVDAIDIRRNEEGLKEFGRLHRTQRQKSNLKDPYNKYWRGAVSLSNMANIVGRELYDGSYSELSDWEHWGVMGIGESITREDNHVTVDHTSERMAGLSLLSAFQCLHQTLDVVDWHLSLGITEKLQDVARVFRESMDTFYTERSTPNPH